MSRVYRHRTAVSAPGGSRLSGLPSQLVQRALKSPAETLRPQTRAPMEQYFGHDFSRVRVHNDGAAARSAQAISADAFTVGSDIVFAPGKYSPETPVGQRLLTHELTHVVQQGTRPSDSAELALAPDNSREEQEAASVSAGRSTPQARHSTARGEVIQRSVAGDVAGGAIGAGAGAGLGALAGGPIGALVGGLIGGLAGIAIGDLLSAEKRSLTPGEVREAKLVFGDSLNYASVNVADATLLSRLTKGNAVTPFETIYFPAGALKKDFSPELQGMAWLIHEMTHAWQYQHGVSVLEKVFWAAHSASVYDYGGEQGLKDAAQQGKKFTSFNTEQQGDIMRNYYYALKTNQDLTPYKPFISEVQGGSGASGVLDDRNMIGPAPKSAVV